MAYWEIPSHETTAINGRWIEAPGWDFFNTLARHYTHLPVIAEDLGVITPDVREVMQHFGFPGMKLLMFAFSSDTNNVHHGAPHTYTRNSIVYTGTHDNNTAQAWYHNEASADERRKLSEYLGHDLREEEVHWELMRLGMSSVANMVVFPMQDLLGLGGEARMNMPATVEGNWKWRLAPEQLQPDLAERLAEMTRIYGRA
jgi:4-alpha-glucanotransferase